MSMASSNSESTGLGTVSTRRMAPRRIKAILAGGLVLGLGAAVTLAAWNDSEFANGSFSAGRFNLEGSATNGTTFTEHATSGAAAPLTFTVSPADLSPGSIIYAPFAVRLDSTTTNNAVVTIAATSTGTMTGLTYKLIQAATWGCSVSTVATATPIPALTALGTAPAGATFPLAKGVAAGTAGDAAFLCLVVTAGAVTQGQTGTATWEFNAASN